MLTSCGFFPFLQHLTTSELAPSGQIMSREDDLLSYTAQTATPPPGFAEVAEYRMRELCQAQGAAEVRRVDPQSDTRIAFECAE